MLLLKKIEKRKWSFNEVDENNNFKRCIIILDFSQSSITNKFEIIVDLMNDMGEKLPGFSEWFEKLFSDYVDGRYNSEILLAEKEKFATFSRLYIDSLNINFSEFSNIEKSSKTSVMFKEEDIKAIAISSTSLKLYSIFWFGFEKTKKWNDSENKWEDDKIYLKLPDNIHREFYKTLVQPCIDAETTIKMFQLIRSRIYRSSITDRYMWDLIKMAISETPETYVMTVFNFLMINMLSTLSPLRNPVPFLVSIIDDSIRWLMRTIYKDKVIYGEAFSGSDDIYGSSISKDSFYVYCCNDVVGKAAKAGMQILEDVYRLNDDEFDKLRDRIDIVDVLTPPMKILTLPIASKVFEIPYKYLTTCIPKHSLLMGIFLHHLSKGILDECFPLITEFLITAPTEKDMKFISTKSSYKIRNLEFIINNHSPVFGFSSKSLKFYIMNNICGVLSASKKNLISVITGKPLKKIPYVSLEEDVIKFYTLLYSNQLENMFSQMREKSELYF
jgi:hypothetical protein